MSSFDRRTLLISLAALAGCGFEPVYRPGGSAENLRGRIRVAPPRDEEGFALTNRLKERLGEAEAADLTLTADIRLGEKPVGVLPDGATSRFNVEGQVDWQLTLTDGSVALSGSERSFTSYSATSTTVATIFAQRDARRRLMVILADQITAQILANADQI